MLFSEMHHQSKRRRNVVHVAHTTVKLIVLEQLLVGHPRTNVTNQLAVAVKVNFAHQTNYQRLLMHLSVV